MGVWPYENNVMRLCTTVVCLKQASSPVLAGRVCPYEGPCPHQRAAIADIGIALLVEPGPRTAKRIPGYPAIKITDTSSSIPPAVRIPCLEVELRKLK